MNNININDYSEVLFKKLNDNAILPKKATEGAIAFDLYIPENAEIPAHHRCIIPLNFAIELPLGFEAKIEPRSGFSAKGMEGYTGNKWSTEPWRYDADVLVGKIDSDYRGNVGVIVRNNDDKFYIKAGTRIAQMTIYYSNPDWHFKEVSELTDTARGKGGFGSTGK